MSLDLRSYNRVEDYKLVDQFLIEHYQEGNQDGNWLEPAWEYMHHHGLLDNTSLGKIGIWEDNGKIVAVSHYEWHLGEAFFQFHPDYRHLRRELLDYAEGYLSGRSDADGRKYLQAFVNDNDPEFISLVRERGYQRYVENTRPMCQFTIPEPFPLIELPAGYRLKSLADECSWVKLNRVLWRGFDHEGEPSASDEDLADRKHMIETPNARLDLKIVIEAPNGDFASFCGMFFVPSCGYAYIEPVATDPDYRRRGLGRAAVLEGIRRCKMLGATIAYVGNDLEFYRSLGFKKVFNSECWLKYLD